MPWSREGVPAAVASGAAVAMVLALGVASGGGPERAAATQPVAADAGTVGVAERESASAVPAQGGCARDRTTGRDGSIGGLVLEVAALLCDPLGPAAGLPPTSLESEEPERLYTLVTRDLAIEPERYAPEDLVPLPGGLYEARREVAAQLTALIGAAAEAGHVYLSVTSGFRDHDTQAGTREDWVRRLGADRADQVSARPGHSEHQLGLAVDVTGACGGFECFGDSDDGRWVAANAHRFGFIVRYPEGGHDVTGYAYEPWHLRYVGPRAAWAMHLQGEAYWERFAPVALDAATAG